MKKKGTLFWSLGATIIAFIFLVLAILEVTTFKRFNPISSFLKGNAAFQENGDWIFHAIKNLGEFEVQEPVVDQNFQKDVVVVYSNHPLSDYQIELEKLFKEKGIIYRYYYKEDYKGEKKHKVLQILFEVNKNFLRILEIKKGKGILVYKKENKPQTVKNKKKLSLKPAYISIVIDDVGRSKELEEEFLSYPMPITFAVIPFELYSKSFSLKAKKRGKEVIIHASMEGGDEIQPYFELSTKTPIDKISKLVSGYEKEIPHAVGLNNHRGSVATSDRKLMTHFFKELKKTNLFFLDSKTTSKSVAREIADQEGILTLERDIFLDSHDDINYISTQLYQLIKLGRKKGYAVGIGHFTNENTLTALRRFIPYFKEHNVHIIPLSQMIQMRKRYAYFRN